LNKGDSILKVFLKNKFWNIRDVDEGCLAFEYKKKHSAKNESLSNISTHQTPQRLMLVTKKRVSYKEYFSPELWESSECCPGGRDRNIFLKCYLAFQKSIN
jgi:hypothetical protein